MDKSTVEALRQYREAKEKWDEQNQGSTQGQGAIGGGFIGQWPPQQPCPNCGRCPTYGRGGYAQPYYGPYYY